MTYHGGFSGGGGSPSSMAVDYVNGRSLDAFGRLRISNPSLRFSGILDTADRSLFWDGLTAVGGTATFQSVSGVFSLSVTTSSGSRVVRQSKEYFDYRAAQGQLILQTFTMGTPKTNLTQRVGYFDDDEGIYLEQAGTVVSVNIKSSVTGASTYETATQAQWNLDTLDGGGGTGNPSGITLSLAYGQILLIDFQWLSLGRVRIGFDIDGVILYIHEFNHANTAAGNAGLPFLRSPRRPVRYEIFNTGTTASVSTLNQICAAVMHEGSEDSPGPVRTVFTAMDNSATTTTTLRGVLGIRLDSANRRASLQMIETVMLNADTDQMTWMLLLNPTWVSGSPTWVATPGVDSITEMSRSQLDVVVSAVVGTTGMPNGAGTLVLDGGFVPGGGANSRQVGTMKSDDTIRAVANYAGVTDEFWLVARLDTGTGLVMGSMTVKEIR